MRSLPCFPPGAGEMEDDPLTEPQRCGGIGAILDQQVQDLVADRALE